MDENTEFDVEECLKPPFRRGGRPVHHYWEKGNFSYVKSKNKKFAAKCNVCSKVLINTAVSRLEQHRRVCPLLSNDDFVDEKQEALDDNPLEKPQLGKYARKNSLSTQFTEIRQDGKKVGARCNDCQKVLRNSAWVRLEKHRCPALFEGPALALDEINENDDLLEDQRDQPIINVKQEKQVEFVHCEAQQLVIERLSPAKVKREKPTTTTASTSRISIPHELNITATPVPQVKIDDALSDLFYGNSLPFEMVEADTFKKFVGQLCPHAKLPSTKYLATTLLEKSYDRYASKLRASEESSILLLEKFTSARTGARTSKLVGFLKNHEKQKTFLKCLDYDASIDSKTDNLTENSPEMNEFLLHSLKTMYQLAEEKYSTKIYAVVWNNLLSVDENKNIAMWHFTSSFYMANLMANEYIDEGVRSTVLDIFEEFKRPQLEEKILESGGNPIQLISHDNNCWIYLNLCKTLITDLEQLKLIATNKFNNVSSQVTKKLFDTFFIESVKDLVKSMSSIHALLTKFLDPATTIGDAAEHWLTLEVPDRPAVDIHKYRQIVLNKYSLVANYLHPKYLGVNLHYCHHDIVEEFLIEQLSSEGLTSVENLKNKKGIFEILLNKNVQSPTTFWGFAERKHKELAELALKLLNIPASTGKLFGNIKLPLNTEHLTLENYEKQLFVYFQLAFGSAKSN